MKVAKKIFIGILIVGLLFGSAFLFIPKGSKSTSSSTSSTSSTTEQSSSSGSSSSSGTEESSNINFAVGTKVSSIPTDFTQVTYTLTVGNLDDSGSFISDNSHFVVSDYISIYNEGSPSYDFIFHTNGSYSNIVTVYLYDENYTLCDSYSLRPSDVGGVNSDGYYIHSAFIYIYYEGISEPLYNPAFYMKFVIQKDSSYNISFDSTGATAMANITQLYVGACDVY